MTLSRSVNDRAGWANYCRTMILYGDTIFTPRLKMRRMCCEDIECMVRWSRDEKAHGDYLSPSNMTEQAYSEQLQSGVNWTEKNKWFVIQPRDGQPIGTIHYWLRAEREECAVAQITIAEPNERGKGFGTEAQKYLIINLFERLKVAEVEMYTDVNNFAQQRCLSKLGFDQVESLSYKDQNVTRIGYLYRLGRHRFQNYPVYHYHYE